LCFAYPEGGSARDNWLATQTSRLDIAGSLKTVRLIQHADLRDGCVRNILAKVPAAYFTGGYEWGRAEATFDGGKSLVDKYLTVWQNQADGSWKIFRNLVIPDK